MFFGDDQRRLETEDVPAQANDNRPEFKDPVHQLGGGFNVALAGGRVDDANPTVEPVQAGVANEVVLGLFLVKEVLGLLPQLGRAFHQVFFFDHVEGGVGGGGRHRVTGGRVDVGGRAERFHDLFSTDHGAQWHPRGQRLTDRHQVRFDAREVLN